MKIDFEDWANRKWSEEEVAKVAKYYLSLSKYNAGKLWQKLVEAECEKFDNCPFNFAILNETKVDGKRVAEFTVSIYEDPVIGTQLQMQGLRESAKERGEELDREYMKSLRKKYQEAKKAQQHNNNNS